MRRVKILLLALLLLASVFPVIVAAEDASLSGDSTVQAGSEITLTLKIAGSGILGVDATLDYDSDALEYCSFSGVQNGWEVIPNGTNFVMFGVENPITSLSDVLTVTFRVKSSASGTVLRASFKDIVVSDGISDSSVGTASWSGTVVAAPSSAPAAPETTYTPSVPETPAETKPVAPSKPVAAAPTQPAKPASMPAVEKTVVEETTDVETPTPLPSPSEPPVEAPADVPVEEAESTQFVIFSVFGVIAVLLIACICVALITNRKKKHT